MSDRRVVNLREMQGWLHRYKWILIAAGALAAVLSISLLIGTERKSWREEVLLSDGTAIEVERRIALERTYYELGQAGMRPTTQRLRFPDGVSFDTEDRLILLHVERGLSPSRWTLLASPSMCETFDKYGRPTPDYLQFDYLDGRWTYRGVQPTFYGRVVNLLVSDREIPNGAYVSHANKSVLNRETKGIAPAYLRVDPNRSLTSVCIQPTHGRKQ